MKKTRKYDDIRLLRIAYWLVLDLTDDDIGETRLRAEHFAGFPAAT